ncbi:hypothetical protein ScPMuIL_015695 [Solemya velum]
MSGEWELWYYPVLAGRGEFVRLLFEEAGVKFKEMGTTGEVVVENVIQGKMGGFPLFAPPVLKRGDFQICQTGTICKYLGKEFGMYPETEEDVWHADMLTSCIHDYIGEGRLAFHGIDPVGSYYPQKKETQPYIDRFVKDRFPRWLKYFEKVLTANDDGKGFILGNKLTYVDLQMLHILRATESQFPEAWEKADYIPSLKAFKDRVSSRPNLQAYFQSERCRPFEGNSMM